MKKLILLSILLIVGCEETVAPLTKHGCLDSQAYNYDSSATIDNNSCTYIDSCGIADFDKANDCIQDCLGTWGGDAVVDNCGICGGDCSGSIYQCTDTYLNAKLEIQPMSFYNLIDWNSGNVELAKLTIRNSTNSTDINFYIDYKVILNNEIAVAGKTFNYYNLANGDSLILSNTNFNPYSIKEHYIESGLRNSLYNIGYLISGNYEFEILIKDMSDEILGCMISLDSLYVITNPL